MIIKVELYCHYDETGNRMEKEEENEENKEFLRLRQYRSKHDVMRILVLSAIIVCIIKD